MIITKEQIEKEVGFKIQDLKLEPLYEGNVCVGLKVNVVPEQKIETINIQFSVREEEKSREYNCTRCGWKGTEDEMFHNNDGCDNSFLICPVCLKTLMECDILYKKFKLK